MTRRGFLLGGATLAAIAAAGGAIAWRNATDLDDYREQAARLREALQAKPETLDWIGHAILAANGHNAQPWQFMIDRSAVEIRPDFSRRTPVVDPDDHHLWASLGCAMENLRLAAAASGNPLTTRFSETGLRADFGGEAEPEPALVSAISSRQCCRVPFDRTSLAANDRKSLERAGMIDGVTVRLFDKGGPRSRIQSFVLDANREQMSDPAFVAELRQWLRFSPSRALTTSDGLFSATSRNPVLPSWVGDRMFSLFFDPDAETDKYREQLDTSLALALFVAEKDEPGYWARAGAACQRFLLQAEALGLTSSFVNQPIEMRSYRDELASIAGFAGMRPNLLLRVGRGPRLPYSLRRPVADVVG